MPSRHHLLAVFGAIRRISAASSGVRISEVSSGMYGRVCPYMALVKNVWPMMYLGTLRGIPQGGL